VGIEEAEDLITDLEETFASISHLHPHQQAVLETSLAN
jgi:hypothetical protein